MFDKLKDEEPKEPVNITQSIQRKSIVKNVLSKKHKSTALSKEMGSCILVLLTYVTLTKNFFGYDKYCSVSNMFLGLPSFNTTCMFAFISYAAVM